MASLRPPKKKPVSTWGSMASAGGVGTTPKKTTTPKPSLPHPPTPGAPKGPKMETFKGPKEPGGVRKLSQRPVRRQATPGVIDNPADYKKRHPNALVRTYKNAAGKTVGSVAGRRIKK